MTDKKDFKDTLATNSCPGSMVFPTPRELEYLVAMREIKERVREIKKMQQACHPDGAEKILDHEHELMALKKDWEGWRNRWKEEVRQRMIFLGHEEP